MKDLEDEHPHFSLNPIKLNDGLMSEVVGIAKKYSHICDPFKIICMSTWREDILVDHRGCLSPAEQPAVETEMKHLGIAGSR